MKNENNKTIFNFKKKDINSEVIKPNQVICSSFKDERGLKGAALQHLFLLRENILYNA